MIKNIIFNLKNSVNKYNKEVLLREFNKSVKIYNSAEEYYLQNKPIGETINVFSVKDDNIIVECNFNEDIDCAYSNKIKELNTIVGFTSDNYDTKMKYIKEFNLKAVYI